MLTLGFVDLSYNQQGMNNLNLLGRGLETMTMPSLFIYF